MNRNTIVVLNKRKLARLNSIFRIYVPLQLPSLCKYLSYGTSIFWEPFLINTHSVI